jgi:hypothetical protein
MILVSSLSSTIDMPHKLFVWMEYMIQLIILAFVANLRKTKEKMTGLLGDALVVKLNTENVWIMLSF